MEEFRPRRIRVYRNGDVFYTGKKLVINGRVNKNFEQLSDDMQLVTGAVRRVYDMETGAIIRTLQDLTDGKYYVAAGAESLKRVPYVTTDENGAPLGVGSTRNLNLTGTGGAGTAGLPPVGAGITMGGLRRGETRQRRKINRSTGGLLLQDQEADQPPVEQPLFGPTSKAYKIIVFENGEASDHGTRMILNYRNCKSFEQLLRHLSSLLVLKTGQVRKLYDAETGRRIRTLQDVHPGHNLTAATFELYKRVPYQLQDLNSPAPVIKRSTDPPKIITFYPNGDSYHTGITVTISKKRFPTLSRLLDTLNHQIELVTGKIQKLYGLDGTRITSPDDLEIGKGYVMVANDDPFIRTRYNVMAIKSVHGHATGLGGVTMRNEYMDKIRPVVEKYRKVGVYGDVAGGVGLHKQKSQTEGDGNDDAEKPRTPGTHLDHKRVHSDTDGAGDTVDHIDNSDQPIYHVQEDVKSESVSRPQTKSRQGPRPKPKSRGDTAPEIQEDESIRNARAHDDVYEDPELKKLEGRTKSVRIVETSKDDENGDGVVAVDAINLQPGTTGDQVTSRGPSRAVSPASHISATASPRSAAQSPNPAKSPRISTHKPKTSSHDTPTDSLSRSKSNVLQSQLVKTRSKDTLNKSMRSLSKENVKSTPKLPTTTLEKAGSRTNL